MVKDTLNNIHSYAGLDDRIRHFSTYRTEKVENYLEFKVEKEYSILFIVEKGAAAFATGWRENRDNHEVTGVLNAVAGEFCLYLPGEPIAVSLQEGAVVTRRRLK